MDVAANMKQATECLDETLLLLNSSLTGNLSKHSPSNLNYRSSFKNKLQEISRNSPIEEVSENSGSPNKIVESLPQKGKIARVDGCVSSPNKKCKLTKKVKLAKTNHKDLPKSAKGSSLATPTGSKNANVKNSKKSVSTLNIKSQNRKKSLPKSSNIETASSSKLPASINSNRALQAKTKQESLTKKRKAVKVILTDIAEAFLTQETENYHSPIKKEPASASNSPNFKCVSPTSPEDNILIKKYFTSELACKQKNCVTNTYGPQFDSEALNCSQNTYNLPTFSPKNLSFDDISEIDKKSSASSSIKNEDFFVCGQNNAVMKMEKIEVNNDIFKQNNKSCIKKTDSEKEGSYKSHNSKVANRVHFYFDEDAIEMVDGDSVASKDKFRKSINKSKARKTVSHKKKNVPSLSKSNLMLSDNISKLGKNSFLVTAEVHSPPNGINALEMKSKMCVSENMEPHVVLTDIFKSNQGLLSEMVGYGVRGNGCLQKTITKPVACPLAEVNTTFVVNKNPASNGNDLNATYVDNENAENRCLPEDREIVRQGKQQRRSKMICYKEPSLNIKMRRLF